MRLLLDHNLSPRLCELLRDLGERVVHVRQAGLDRADDAAVRSHAAMELAGEPDASDLRFPEFSPDGRRVALDRVVQGNRDTWVLDVARRVMTRLTSDASTDMMPVWSPDGTRLAHSSSGTGAFDLYVKPSNGSGAEVRLVTSPNTKSPNGRWVAYQTDESGRFEVVVHAFPDAGGKSQVSTAGGVAPRWRADGQDSTSWRLTPR